MDRPAAAGVPVGVAVAVGSPLPAVCSPPPQPAIASAIAITGENARVRRPQMRSPREECARSGSIPRRVSGDAQPQTSPPVGRHFPRPMGARALARTYIRRRSDYPRSYAAPGTSGASVHRRPQPLSRRRDARHPPQARQPTVTRRPERDAAPARPTTPEHHRVPAARILRCTRRPAFPISAATAERIDNEISRGRKCANHLGDNVVRLSRPVFVEAVLGRLRLRVD